MPKLFRLISPAPLSVRLRSKECYIYLYRVMYFVGWIPPEQGIKRYVYLLWMSLVYGFSGLYLPIGLGFSLVIDLKRMTPGEFLDVTEVFVNIFGASVKAFLSLDLLTCLRGTEEFLDQLDQRLQSDRDRLKIQKAIARCNSILVLYVKCYCGYLITTLIAGVYTRHPPWMVYNPLFDWRDGTGALLAQSIFEYSIMLMMACMILILDIFPLIFIIICRGHVNVLKDHIRTLRSDPLKKEADNYEELVSCICDHKSILNCCDLMRSIISRIIFVQFLLIGIVLGLTMINVLYFSGISRGISSIAFLGAVLLQTFPFCYLCDLLEADCKDLANFSCQSNWIDAELKYKSTLRIFIHHLQQPIHFTAGKIFPISIGSNLRVAKFAFSVMTIVQQMNLSDRFK